MKTRKTRKNLPAPVPPSLDKTLRAFRDRFGDDYLISTIVLFVEDHNKERELYEALENELDDSE